MFVYGHSLENYLIGVCVVDPEVLTTWCKEHQRDEEEVKNNINDQSDLKEEIF
jgi:hypothetical protein